MKDIDKKLHRVLDKLVAEHIFNEKVDFFEDEGRYLMDVKPPYTEGYRELPEFSLDYWEAMTIVGNYKDVYHTSIKYDNKLDNEWHVNITTICPRREPHEDIGAIAPTLPLAVCTAFLQELGVDWRSVIKATKIEEGYE